MRLTLFILLGLFSQSTLAQTADCAEGSDTPLATVEQVFNAVPACPNWNKIKNICAYISNRTDDPQPLNKNLKYMYQRKVFEAACVDVKKDDEATINKKISAMWASFENKLICNNMQFDVTNGSVIKFAAVSKFDPFIYDIIKWKVDLNRIDASDGRTTLDYIKYQIQRNKGNPIEKKLQEYYDQLRTAGAKHQKEL